MRYNDVVDSNIGMRKCLESLCPSNRAAAVLRKHGLMRTFKGFEIAVDPTGNTFYAKDGTKVVGGYEILQRLCTKDGKYDRKLHVAVEERMIKVFCSYMEMVNFRSLYGHIGYLKEVTLNEVEAHNMAFEKHVSERIVDNIVADTTTRVPWRKEKNTYVIRDNPATTSAWDRTLDLTNPDALDTLHMNETKLSCPYCGSTDVVTDRGRTMVDEFDDESPAPSDASWRYVAKARDRDGNWVNNPVDIGYIPECNDYEMNVKPVRDRHYEWLSECYLDRKDMLLDLQEKWDAEEATFISYDYLPECIAEMDKDNCKEVVFINEVYENTLSLAL